MEDNIILKQAIVDALESLQIGLQQQLDKVKETDDTEVTLDMLFQMDDAISETISNKILYCESVDLRLRHKNTQEP